MNARQNSELFVGKLMLTLPEEVNTLERCDTGCIKGIAIPKEDVLISIVVHIDHLESKVPREGWAPEKVVFA